MIFKFITWSPLGREGSYLSLGGGRVEDYRQDTQLTRDDKKRAIKNSFVTTTFTELVVAKH